MGDFKMKKFGKILVTGAAVMLMSVSAFAANAADSGASIYVNGVKIEDASAKTVDGYTMVPVRFVAEELGCRVEWSDADRTVTVKDGATVINFTEGVKSMIVDERIKAIPVAPFIEGGRVFVPLRAVSEGLDIDIAWNEMAKIVSVYSANAAKINYNSDFSQAPEAVLTTVYMRPDEEIVIPVNSDLVREIGVFVNEADERIIDVKEGYLDGRKALFITAGERGAAGIMLYYEGYNSTSYHKTYVNVRVVDRKEKSLIKFDEMLSEKGYFFKDILKEIEDNKLAIEKRNGISVFDRSNEEFSKLFVGDKGMIILPVAYDKNASGVFDIAYDTSCGVKCEWVAYGEHHAIMITSENEYTLAPVRVSFKENNSGKVSFTVTNKDMSVKEELSVKSFGNNSLDSTWWDFNVRSISEDSYELKDKVAVLKDTIVYVK